MMKRRILMAAVAALALTSGGMLAGCANMKAAPSPQLTFENYQGVTLNAQVSEVVENYAVRNDPRDVSGQFVIAPSEAVKRYAAHRFPANGMGNGRFTIEIEDARMHMETLRQDNKVLSWSGVGQEDQYRLLMRLKVTPLPDQMLQSASTILRFERTLVMPSSVTLAEREMRQVQFLEKLIADIDAAILRLLDQTPAMRQ